MEAPSFGTVLKAAILAGLLAGLTAAVFHLFATEPVIERAIAVEAQRAAAAGVPRDEAVVGREVQRSGLIVGFVAYGLIWSTLFAIAYRAAQLRMGLLGSPRLRWLAALAAYWAVALFPFLKYPANPPGVGDPATIGYRQTLYLSLIGLSIVGTFVCCTLVRKPAARRPWLPLAALVAFYLILFVAMPPNPDPIKQAADLVVPFRALSLAGLTIFWLVLGFFFALLLKPSRRAAPSRT